LILSFEFVDPLEMKKQYRQYKTLYMKGMTPINITVDDKENSHKRWFWAIAVYTTTSYDSLLKISWVLLLLKSYRISTASRIFIADALIKLRRKTKAHCNNKNGELKDIIYRKNSFCNKRELPYRSFTLDSVF
jgi:alkyl hydroperoxide reductase subunit AhpC